MEQGEQTAFTPAVPILFVLMQYAFVLSSLLTWQMTLMLYLPSHSNGGSLHSFISSRCGVAAENFSAPSLSKAERVRRFRFRQTGAIHLLRLDEIVAIFRDITQGLGFLHKRNILHLDIKSENVLLNWDEEDLL